MKGAGKGMTKEGAISEGASEEITRPCYNCFEITKLNHFFKNDEIFETHAFVRP